jgi:predicted transposase YbfD/YdcC
VAQSAIAPADRDPVAPAAAEAAAGDLLEMFRLVGDGRSGQGRDHPVAAVLALAAAAVVAGMKGYTAIAGWVKDVPPPVLADLYMRVGAGPARPPSKATIWRVVTDADAEAFDAVVGAWLQTCQAVREEEAADGGDDDDDAPGLVPVRLDGKTIRGAKDADGNQRHLLAALSGCPGQPQVIAAQAEVGAKTNEVPMATHVLGQLDLNGTVVTADALHTVKATAEFIHDNGGEFVLPVKENRQALFDALDVLPWDQAPVAHSQTQKGHGRIETRTIQVLPAPENLPFPHVRQVWLIERYVSDLAGNLLSAVAALGVASPGPDKASPAGLAGYVRGHWGIESWHWLRDTLYREDHSPVRTRSGPRIMAALRNLAISALRLAGRTDTTEATRWASRSMERPFAILGLAP